MPASPDSAAFPGALSCKKTRKETSVIYVIAELRVKPGTADKAIAAARLSCAETVKENGCISYDIHQSVTDASRLVLVERWESPEALKRHMETPHFKAWRAASPDFVAERKVEIVTPEKIDRP
jgi:quinol monooxygenase YgiN